MRTERAGKLVVVGAGLAGLVVGLRVAQAGYSVIVLEKGTDDRYLCNSRYTGGLFHIAMEDMRGNRDWMLRNVLSATRGYSDLDLAKALVDTAPRAVKWLKEQGVRFIKGGPDGLRRNVLAPPGMRRTGLRPQGRPYWIGRAGDVMLRTLAERLAAFGGLIQRGTRARRLLMEEGRCVGVEAEVSGGLVQIRANAVALADGGFQSNLELMKRFIAPKPDRLMQRNAGTGGGDALLMAEAVGAKLIGTESFYGHLLYREAFRDDRFWPYPMLDTTVTGSIVVDASGRRFCDEGRGGIYVANMIARHDDPLSVTAVFDSAIWNEGPARNFLLPANPNFTKAGGQLLRANTVHELAARIGVDSDALTRTVNAHNKVARGEAPEADSVPRTTATYRPWAIEKPPFLAVPVCAGITYTLGGIATDADGQVIADSNKPIRGLFAAGACTGGLEGGSGVGYSGGLSKSSVFGLRAGERIVNELEHS